MAVMDSKRVEGRVSLSQPAIIDKTKNVITKWKAKRNAHRRSNNSRASLDGESVPSNRSGPISATTFAANVSRLPTEIYEQILAAVGYDIPLLPQQLDRLKFPYHFFSYFQYVDYTVGARNQTLRNCRLVSTTWNEIASRHLNRYLLFRAEKWKEHVIWRNEGFRRQVRHVWVVPPSIYEETMPNPWYGLFGMIFTGFPNLETLYASFPGCYESFYCEQFLRLHVPRNLHILGLDGPVLRGPTNPARRQLQLYVLRLFPNLETLIEVGSSSDDILIVNGFIHNVTCSSIKMAFTPTFELPYFSRLQTLSLTGGHIVQDDSIVSFVSLCPKVQDLHICGFDRSFTMRGPSGHLHISTQLTYLGLEQLLEVVGSGLESLHLAIRQSEQLWGDGKHHLCHILARTCSNLRVLSIGEEDSFNRPIRSTSCCRDLFDMAKWENLADCHLCVYPGRGGCLDQSDGSLNALVESARAVALRNSNGLGTIIRIKVDYRTPAGTIWVSTADTMATRLS